MKVRLPIVPACALALTLTGVGVARAQCPFQQPNPWNGDEPPEFTHYLDNDEDGICDGYHEARKVNGVFENRTYPDCTTLWGYHQVAHGHWEYTHLQAEVPGDSEEKENTVNEACLAVETAATKAPSPPARAPRPHLTEMTEYGGVGGVAAGRLGAVGCREFIRRVRFRLLTRRQGSRG